MMNSVYHLIRTALNEDIGSGDITTDNLIAPEHEGKGIIVAKEPLVLAGLEVAKQVFLHLDSKAVFNSEFKDGDRVNSGKIVFEINAKLCSLLLGERTALNFIQRLSGIATCVRSFKEKIGNKNVRLVDTRKTAPGWRVLEKMAVRTGGAYNHRMGLYDGVLIKDNHIAVSGGITNAVSLIKTKVSHLVKIEIEVNDLAGVKEALNAGVDIIMLDNMSIKQIREAVAFIAGRAVVEVSGGITIDNINIFADSGADIISVGALTHSARCVDLSMTIKPLDSAI